MRDSYHNTTRERPERLTRYEAQAKRQDLRILEFFKNHRGLHFTPSQVHKAVGGGAPITSIRRAMTNLTSTAHLVKTQDKVEGPYGRPEYQWMLPGDGIQLRLVP